LNGHEIVHALNPHEHHGKDWKATCGRIGARPERCYSVSEVALPQKRIYIYVCPNCKREINRNYRFHKKYACGECCEKLSNNKWDERFILTLKGAS
jgi:predicted SprT family Zn-dependent metalloprotease